MKKILIIILGLWSFAYGQTVNQIRFDTTKIMKVAPGTSELKILNSTMGVVGGAFINAGGGWGQWRPVVDSVTKNETGDSIRMWSNGLVFKTIKDSIGSASFARDTIGFAANEFIIEIINAHNFNVRLDTSATGVIYSKHQTDSAIAAGGGGGVTLQNAFDAAPTANPTINAHYNTFKLDSLKTFSLRANARSSSLGSWYDADSSKFWLRSFNSSSGKHIIIKPDSIDIYNATAAATDYHLKLDNNGFKFAKALAGGDLFNFIYVPKKPVVSDTLALLGDTATIFATKHDLADYTGNVTIHGQLNADSIKQGGYAVMPYKALSVILHQTSTSNPTGVYGQNTTGTTYTLARTGAGIYTLTADSGTPFTSGKTGVQITSTDPTGSAGSPYVFNCTVVSNTIIQIATWDVALFTTADDLLQGTLLQVFIYN